jgi:hypothetical protein
MRSTLTIRQRPQCQLGTLMFGSHWPNRPELLMTSISCLRIGLVTILGVTAMGTTLSARQTPETAESRQLVLHVLASGQPVTNATVDCGPGGTHRTDNGGTAECRFAAADVERLRVSLTARAPGFAVEAWLGDIPAGSTVHAITLVPEVPVTGRVLNPEGQPLPNVSVTLRMFDPAVSLYAPSGSLPDHRISNAETDEAGRFTLRGASPGRTYRLAVNPFGPLRHTERFVQGGAPPIDVRLPGTGRLEVDFTTTPDLLPLVPELLSQVTLEWRDENGGPWRRHFPGSRGSSAQGERVWAFFSDLPAGIVRIVTPYLGSIAGDVSEPIAVIANARNRASMRLVPVREVRLQVLDDDNQPVTDALLSVSEGRGRRFVPLDADGWATIAVHPAHDATVTVRRPGYSEATSVIAAGVQNSLPIILHPVR